MCLNLEPDTSVLESCFNARLQILFLKNFKVPGGINNFNFQKKTQRWKSNITTSFSKEWLFQFKVEPICPFSEHVQKQSATDGSSGSKYWIPGFGGLIQGQIYNPAIGWFQWWTKSLHRKLLFNQASILNCLFRKFQETCYYGIATIFVQRKYVWHLFGKMRQHWRNFEQGSNI